MDIQRKLDVLATRPNFASRCLGFDGLYEGRRTTPQSRQLCAGGQLVVGRGVIVAVFNLAFAFSLLLIWSNVGAGWAAHNPGNGLCLNS